MPSIWDDPSAPPDDAYQTQRAAYTRIGSTVDGRVLYQDPATKTFYTKAPGPQGAYVLYSGGYYPAGYGPGSTPKQTPGATTPGQAFFDAAGKFTGDYQGYFNSLTAGKPASSQTLLSLAPDLQKAGITLEPANAAGVTSKMRFPDGRVVRVGNYFDGGGTPSWSWTVQGAGGGTGTGSLADMSNPSLYERFAGQPPPGWTPPEGTEFQGPYTSPSADEVFNEPGYQFRSQEGMRPITQNASAMGLAKSMGTFKDLMAWNQSFASSEYGNVDNRKRANYGLEASRRNASYDRAWQEYLKGGDIFQNSQNSAFDKLYRTNSLGLDAASR